MSSMLARSQAGENYHVAMAREAAVDVQPMKTTVENHSKLRSICNKSMSHALMGKLLGPNKVNELIERDAHVRILIEKNNGFY